MDAKVCPQCGELLHRFMIRMKHAVVMCANDKCMYPFNTPGGIESNLVYVEGSELLEASTKIEKPPSRH
ncbi:Hypothetical protein J6897_03097 [Nakaseomyces glabratus]